MISNGYHEKSHKIDLSWVIYTMIWLCIRSIQWCVYIYTDGRIDLLIGAIVVLILCNCIWNASWSICTSDIKWYINRSINHYLEINGMGIHVSLFRLCLDFVQQQHCQGLMHQCLWRAGGLLKLPDSPDISPTSGDSNARILWHDADWWLIGGSARSPAE